MLLSSLGHFNRALPSLDGARILIRRYRHIDRLDLLLQTWRIRRTTSLPLFPPLMILIPIRAILLRLPGWVSAILSAHEGLFQAVHSFVIILGHPELLLQCDGLQSGTGFLVFPGVVPQDPGLVMHVYVGRRSLE